MLQIPNAAYFVYLRDFFPPVLTLFPLGDFFCLFIVQASLSKH